ncbi:MAG: ABC transporter permease [Verrucomicrobia bacterium]|nr:ABC transporter permease [Verrucomicrobiota bacterium]
MNRRTLALRSLVHFARNHLGVVLGAAIGSAVLTGALVVGDSVRHSLLQMALSRLGRTEIALGADDRLLRESLAGEIQAKLGTPAAAVLLLPGAAAHSDGSARANQIQVAGVSPDFWSLAPGSSPPASPQPEEVFLNLRLAAQLGAKSGDFVVLRVAKPSQLSRDAPISPQEDSTVALRARVVQVLDDAQFGRFSLRASQVPPFNAFVSRAWLQSRVDTPGQANLYLAAAPDDAVRTSSTSNGKSESPLPARSSSNTVQLANQVLAQTWNLDDAALSLRPAESNRPPELRSSRVFLDAPIIEAALRLPAAQHRVLTYFVNDLASGDQQTPYSMVTATDAPWMPPDLGEDEILVTPWLADDLALKPGSRLSLKYYVVGAMRKLEEQTTHFTVRAILPAQGPHDDPLLMPDFPGLATANNCREWDAGFPIDFDKIRTKDNQYWEQKRGTPKAFVTLKTGQRLWSNRFGNLTSIRFHETGVSTHTLATQLLQTLSPLSLGLRFEEVRGPALAAATGGQDFGQLFIGFSFFLVLSALLLTSLLFQFGLEQRVSEMGLLLALGWPAQRVRQMLLGEGMVLAWIGSVAGLLGGVAYARLMLWGLANLWKDAVGTTSLQFHASPSTMLIGHLAGWFVAAATLWLAIHGTARRPARELLSPQDVEWAALPPSRSAPGKQSTATSIAWITGLSGLALAGMGLARPGSAPALFFGAGGLLLVAGLGSMSSILGRLDHAGNDLLHSAALAARNLARRPKRSLAVAGLLACGGFMIVAVSANRLDAGRDAQDRGSGTGGFALLAESSHPVVHDLNAQEGREFHNLDGKALTNVHFVPFRVREGEDASCLNLNRAQEPRLLGVDPALLQSRKAFTFSRLLEAQHRDAPWLSLLDSTSDPALVPAIGDAASIQWALGKSLGDTLEMTDEKGRPFRLLLVGAVSGSILQGQLVISEKHFLDRFPSATGYRMFLVDAPSDRVGAVRTHLSQVLRDLGLEVTPAVERLAAYNAVQNTYLNTFQVLGGLGLLLGSFGVGIVVLRAILERRAELALLSALGWKASAVRQLMLREHLTLFLWGMAIGTLASAVAVYPALTQPASEFPLASITATLALIAVNGALWVWCAARSGTRGELLEPLRRQV